jgi:hypothetical protein
VLGPGCLGRGCRHLDVLSSSLSWQPFGSSPFVASDRHQSTSHFLTRQDDSWDADRPRPIAESHFGARYGALNGEHRTSGTVQSVRIVMVGPLTGTSDERLVFQNRTVQRHGTGYLFARIMRRSQEHESSRTIEGRVSCQHRP